MPFSTICQLNNGSKKEKNQEYTEKISCFGFFLGLRIWEILELQQYFSNRKLKLYWWEKHEYKNPVMKQDQNVQ